MGMRMVCDWCDDPIRGATYYTLRERPDLDLCRDCYEALTALGGQEPVPAPSDSEEEHGRGHRSSPPSTPMRQCEFGHKAPLPHCGACYVFGWSKGV